MTERDLPRKAPDSPAETDRRTFVKRGLLAGGALSVGTAAVAEWMAARASPSQPRSGHGASPRGARRETASSSPRRPNVLVIVVDQLRTPQWIPAASLSAGLLPNLAALRRGGVSFEHHYTASNDCTPARSALLTGLYTHQTGCMITGGSTLDPEFPTWGTLMREHGYRTYWYGKWHLTHGDNLWSAPQNEGALERYGFTGGTYPSPDGAPGQGWRVDPLLAEQFKQWFAQAPREEPWCTTVSFVNPHDIAWWYSWSQRFPAEIEAPSVVDELPPNFETPEDLIARGKPRLQLSFQETAARSFGTVPFTGPEVVSAWLPFLDLYMKLQHEVDNQIGAVLRTLESRPEVAANTVVLFTSDHGEYGASHGLRGKGASAYEEATRVPLIVKDPRGVLTSAPTIPRSQLTSSVDIAPLLLTIATGSDAWRSEQHYAHLAGRLDLTRILKDPSAPGRPYVLHATDEVVTEFALEPYAASAPLHITALRTPTAKYAVYSNWQPGGIATEPGDEDRELYDYRTPGGRSEVHNTAGQSPLEEGLNATLQEAQRDELRESLPRRLHRAHGRGMENYFITVERAALKAIERRERLTARGPATRSPLGPRLQQGLLPRVRG